ncbi:Autophagy-related protein 11 [Phytophthora cactorum]|nr:Autophagy-related protein 11 [Phytophthora cactorum]
MTSDDEQQQQQTNTVELHPKRTTSFATRRKKKAPVQYDLATRIAMEREKTKYWARILLLFPLVPVYLALTTIVFGGVIINVATNDCNADLMSRHSHELGIRIVLSMSPTLYIFSQYEVAAFWVVFIAAVAFFVNEKTARMRQDKLDQWTRKKEDVKRAKEQQEQETRDRVLQDAQDEARKLEEEQRLKIAAEQQKLYGSDEEEGGEHDDNEQDLDGVNEYRNNDDGGEQQEEEEEEEDEEQVPLTGEAVFWYLNERERDPDREARRGLTSSMSSANGQTITVCGNVFRLVETIGRGSYGTVHKAINLSSGAAVAVKMIGKDKLRRPHERQSIEKEIETMRVAVEQFENGHPHIVRLLCTKESQHHIFIVQEYCAGGDIAQLMKANNGLTEELARLYMSQLASGLQFLRSQNVVHRDLKPANLLLSSRNMATAKLKIADFGFARELESEMMAESVVGSPLYMAPELLEYKSYDAKADLWSVGIILYEMLANEHPFLVVDKVHATNHLALRRNIYRYFERYGQFDYRRTSSSETKQPLVAEKQPEYEDWATFSDEYVMVENEYEDVGRKILDGQDLNVDLGDKTEAKHHGKEHGPVVDAGSTIVDGGIEIRDVVIDTSSPRNGKVAADPVDTPVPTELETKMPDREVIPAAKTDNLLVDERRQWVTDDNRLEELLGICYKSFSCGSVALFVPTPFGDYIAFHEGCPHHYLSEESIAASKKDDRNPPYVLGHIVYIEDHETTDKLNPYCLREGTKYHVVSVTPLATSSHDANGSVGTVDSSSASDELPLSQVLTGRTVASDVEENGLHGVASEQSSAEVSHGSMEHQRISFRSFQISSLALFFLKGGKLPYVAFNEGAPNYYLANESIQAAILGVGSDRTPPAYICGEIIFIDTFQATEDFNPYRLPYGTRFHVVTVANPKRT